MSIGAVNPAIPRRLRRWFKSPKFKPCFRTSCLAKAGEIAPRVDPRNFTLETVCDAYWAFKTGNAEGKLVADVVRRVPAHFPKRVPYTANAVASPYQQCGNYSQHKYGDDMEHGSPLTPSTIAFAIQTCCRRVIA